ncbi:MAG TPA: hypothetical protein VJ508_12040, partial [Saprospiraceae bacterium]|nr:hypothetical protein [Saprospiraceae bacterium]
MKITHFYLAALALLALITACTYDMADNNSGPYFPQVRSIIQTNCYSCHLSTGSWEGRPTAFDDDTAISERYAAIKAAVA